MNQNKINKLLSLAGFLFFFAIVLIIGKSAAHDTTVDFYTSVIEKRNERIRAQEILIRRQERQLDALRKNYLRCINTKANGRE
jgi:hypothetical protein